MNDQKHWLVRPETIRLLWIVGGVILALTVIAEAFVDLHPHFPIEGIFGFNAWYGLLVCVAMVLGAKVLGILLKRTDSYYDETQEGDGS